MKKSSTLKLLTALISIWLFSTQTIVAQPACQAGFVYTIGSTSPNGTMVSLYDSSWSAGTIVGWQWSFGNGSGSSSQNPTTTLQPGNNYVCLTITAIVSNQTCTSTQCDTIVIAGGTSCNATFNYSTNVFGTQFNTNGTTNVSWFWDFGDGNTSTQQNPSHLYTANGTYNACLTVLDANGSTCTSCQSVTIGSSAGCQAYFTSSTTPGSNVVAFTDMSQGNSQYFAWSFGDGTSSTLQNPVHTYNGPGIYSVCLTIIDSVAMCSDTYCDSIVIQNTTGCDPSFGYQTSPAFGTVFNAAANVGSTSWTWDFGDGSTASGANVTHVYAPGTYVACLTVTTGSGLSCTSCQTVVIQGSTTCSSNFAIYPDTTTLHSYFAYNLASGVGPLSYVWSWGDGTSSTGAYPSHTYASSGTYTICLTITDATGCTSNTCYQFSLLRLMSGVPVTINVIAGSTGINESNILSSLIISPNPASEYVKANFNLSNDTQVQYTLRNITGQNVLVSPSEKYKSGSHEIKLDVSELSSGIYMLEIIAGDKKNFSKIIVQ